MLQSNIAIFCMLYTVKISVDFSVELLATSCQSISRYFLQEPVNIFRNQAKDIIVFVIQPYNPTKVFSSTVG